MREDDCEIVLLNDGLEDKPVFKREHLVYLQMTGTFGITEGSFSLEQRKWTGNGDICYNKKQNKKRMSFTSREVGCTKFSPAIVDPKSGQFRGSRFLRCEKPKTDVKLYPMSRENRTLIG